MGGWHKEVWRGLQQYTAFYESMEDRQRGALRGVGVRRSLEGLAYRKIDERKKIKCISRRGIFCLETAIALYIMLFGGK
jgi:hypothetical protein